MGDWPDIDLYGFESDIRPISHTDLKIAAFGRRQHRAVARRQLLRVGIEPGAIKRRIQTGRLFPKYRGVYAIGAPALTQHGEWSAAALSVFPPAALGMRSGAALWEWLRDRWPIQVIAPTFHTDRRGVRYRQAPSLTRGDLTIRAGIPVTSPARTLVDLAATEDEGTVRRAFREADRQNRLVFRELQVALGSRRGRKGSGLLVALIDAATAAEPTKSNFEEIWVDFCVDHDLPAPTMNAMVAGYEVDASWSGTPLIVELDSWSWHHDRQAFENDRAKWEQLQVAGYTVLPITYRRLAADPIGVAASVRGLLEC